MNYAWELSLTPDKRPQDLFGDMMCRKQSNLFSVSELCLLFYCEHVKRSKTFGQLLSEVLVIVFIFVNSLYKL